MTDLAHVCFRDVAWLQLFPLNKTTVLDYFAMSQFYERTCNNEVLKMQARFTDNEALFQQLHKMTGIEYAVLKSVSPNLFIIAKRTRVSPTQTKVLACYYVIDGSIYMAPNLYTVACSRLSASMHYLREAIAYGSSHVGYSPLQQRYLCDNELDTDQTSDAESARLERIVVDTIQRELGDKHEQAK